MANKVITSETKIRVRFGEVDSMGIAWHGNYIKYFEDGREDFGLKYGLSYLDVHEKGFVIPIVKINCEYKRPLKYGDSIIVETTMVSSPAAKLIFSYKITNALTGELVATGESVQVFLNSKNELQLNLPRFFEEWKTKWEI